MSFWQSRPRRRRTAGRAADALLERFGLAEHRERRGAELPGGVRKLLDIAMALAAQAAAAAARRADQRRRRRGEVPDHGHGHGRPSRARPVTVLFVEHDMDIVERYADRVVAFYGGRIIADGAPAEVLRAAEVRRYVTGELRA